MTLQERYEKVCQAYITRFERKQGLELEFWLDDKVGSIACFGDIYFFSFDDIRYDMDTDQPVWQIIQWLEDSTFRSKHINYKSYCMGARYSGEQEVPKAFNL